MSNPYRGPSIDASYQVSVHMAEGFQRRRLKCEKLTDDRRRTADAHDLGIVVVFIDISSYKEWYNIYILFCFVYDILVGMPF
jgi:hypothetical protein